MNFAPVIIFIGGLIFLAHLFAAIFNRTKIPDVLFLILIGLFLGPVFGIVTPEDFGVVGPVFTTVTLVFILFESGIELRYDSLRRAFGATVSLTSLNFVLTMILVGTAAMMVVGLSPLTAYMLGAIVGGTSSAVVVPLVRQLRMRPESSAVLVLESAFSDVFTIVVPLALLEAYKLGEMSVRLMAGQMILAFFLALLIGVLGAFLWSILLNKVRTLQNAIFTTPAFVFVVFGIAEWAGFSGPIAALAFGITMGNIELLRFPGLKRYVPHEAIAFNETEKLFFSEAGFLLKTFFFVYIGLSIQLTDLGLMVLGLFLIVLLLVLRVAVVLLSIPRSTPASDVSFMAVMIPKGLGAAVLASVPLQEGVVGGELIQAITFSIVLFSTVLPTILISLLERTRFSEFYGRIFSGFGRPKQSL